MGVRAITVSYLIVMVAVVVGADLLFFRHRFGERLIANVGIVLVFTVFYWAFLRHR